MFSSGFPWPETGKDSVSELGELPIVPSSLDGDNGGIIIPMTGGRVRCRSFPLQRMRNLLEHATVLCEVHIAG